MSFFSRLEQLHLVRNGLKNIFYPDHTDEYKKPFENLQCLLVGIFSSDNLICALKLFSLTSLEKF